MDDSIPLKVLIIDPVPSSADALRNVLQQVETVLTIHTVQSLTDAPVAIEVNDINTVYIDPIALDLDPATRFVFQVRRRYPTIVFVLYVDSSQYDDLGEVFYGGRRIRFRHYYQLYKDLKHESFRSNVLRTVGRCEAYLSRSLTQEKIRRLKAELTIIQDAADTTEESVSVPLKMLKDIQEQLDARGKEAKPSVSPAEFLGVYPQSIKGDRCFVVMPYSEEWSSGVEQLVKEVCDDVGFECAVASTMDGRFVARDIWEGVSGSGVILADLTGANANVTYEIGLADAIGREVVLIGQSLSVPFDFLGHRLIAYENSVPGALELRNKLTDRLRGIKAHCDQESANAENPG
ncbi:MAG: response regulator transcription factor [Phycisphaerales bacterium]|nr:MAG: response regulator transcription factor [Phycisphaerales bacterium]